MKKKYFDMKYWIIKCENDKCDYLYWAETASISNCNLGGVFMNFFLWWKHKKYSWTLCKTCLDYARNLKFVTYLMYCISDSKEMLYELFSVILFCAIQIKKLQNSAVQTTVTVKEKWNIYSLFVDSVTRIIDVAAKNSYLIKKKLTENVLKTNHFN